MYISVEGGKLHELNYNKRALQRIQQKARYRSCEYEYSRT